MKTCRTFCSIILAISLALVFSNYIFAQVTIGPEDIPVEENTVQLFYTENSDDPLNPIPVQMTPEGPDQEWDFHEGSTENVEVDTIVNPATSPLIGFFPDANRVVFGGAPFGLPLGESYRYELVDDTGWYMLGFGVEYGDALIPLVIPDGLILMPLPVEYGDTWMHDLTLDYTIGADLLPPLPIDFDSLRLELDFSGTSEADGWGLLEYPGGMEDVLRVRTELEGVVNGVAIVYIFGFPIEIPIGELLRLYPTIVYSWYAPVAGEIAMVASFANETNPEFTDATLVRRRFESPLALTAEPWDPAITIPAGGGDFRWDATVFNTSDDMVTFDAWTELVLPNGIPYGPLNLFQNLNLAGGETLMASPQQVVPGVAPAGTYTYIAAVGDYPFAYEHDSFTFDKIAAVGPLAAKTTGRMDGWNIYGWFDDEDEDFISSSASPGTFVMHNAWPNPFNPTTNVNIELTRAAEIQVNVYDMLGRNVAKIASGQYSPGNHNLVFDASDLASGTYLVRAIVPGQADQVQKVVLVK